MIRISEMVLPGHPDKFCDQVADAVIAETVAIDRDAYGQVEVSTWSDQVWLSGGICTRKPLAKSMRDIVVETGLALGYVPGNHIDATRYKVTSTVCERIGDPTQWSRHVNDQSVVIGWAGYDAKVRYLPPEHFLAHALREAETGRCGRCGGRGCRSVRKFRRRAVQARRLERASATANAALVLALNTATVLLLCILAQPEKELRQARPKAVCARAPVRTRNLAARIGARARACSGDAAAAAVSRLRAPPAA